MDSGGAGGYFQWCLFHTPIRTPISVSQGKRALASRAMCPREARMNLEEQESARSGE